MDEQKATERQANAAKRKDDAKAVRVARHKDATVKKLQAMIRELEKWSAAQLESIEEATQAAPIVLGSTSDSLGATVMLTAATLPGAALYPWHSTSSSLPDLPNKAWPELLVPLPDGHAQAAMLLSTPDFRKGAGVLGERISNLLHPKLHLLTHSVPGASDGAVLFLGDAVLRGPGAVGCFFRGAGVELDELVNELMCAERRQA
ncbi:hypothetical protein WJX81_003673 [Elliptochloris bilobata]|uniref:Uncharacterized protein n=1 Tax=Elliptochloris bilobata TaxID=381761 RepID=A0AAW1RZD7_9CHLO